MAIKNTISKMAESIGFDIGMASDEEQAELLTGFLEALRVSMNASDLAMQCAYIAPRLAPKHIAVLKVLYEAAEILE